MTQAAAETLEHLHLIGAAGAAEAAATAGQIGFKAYNLQRMALLGVPVPPAFVLGTALGRSVAAGARRLDPAGRDCLAAGIRRLELATGLSFGHARRPLLVSVRSGAAVSMPGMLDTVLNVGLCDATAAGLLRLTGNPRLVWDSYRRLVQGFGEVVLGLAPTVFGGPLSAVLEESRAPAVEALDFRGLRLLTRRFLEAFAEAAGEPFPQSPADQLETAAAAVFASWWGARARSYRASHGIPDDLGTAVTVQQMVFGNAGATSGAGVGFTRDPSNGTPGMLVEFAANAQGDDVVSGRCPLVGGESLELRLPEAHEDLVETAGLLEREFRDAQEFEFTVQSGRLYFLQTRTAKRAPLAALRIAVDMLEAGLWAPAEAAERLRRVDLDALGSWDVEPDQAVSVLANATPASTGVVAGRVALGVAAALAFARDGEPAILVREDISTDDIAGIESSAGVLSVRGGRTAHAAVVARELGKVCLVGCDGLCVDDAGRRLQFEAGTLREGDWICLDANRGRVLEGKPSLSFQRPLDLLHRLAACTGPPDT
jgi:pyruvate,orthophosphate dikinase